MIRLLLPLLLVATALISGCGPSDELPEQNVATFNSANPEEVAKQPVLPGGAVTPPGAPPKAAADPK